MIRLILFTRSLRGQCYGNRYFGANRGKLIQTPSFCALASHNGWRDRNMDGRFSTSDEKTGGPW